MRAAGLVPAGNLARGTPRGERRAGNAARGTPRGVPRAFPSPRISSAHRRAGIKPAARHLHKAATVGRAPNQSAVPPTKPTGGPGEAASGYLALRAAITLSVIAWIRASWSGVAEFPCAGVDPFAEVPL